MVLFHELSDGLEGFFDLTDRSITFGRSGRPGFPVFGSISSGSAPKPVTTTTPFPASGAARAWMRRTWSRIRSGTISGGGWALMLRPPLAFVLLAD